LFPTLALLWKMIIRDLKPENILCTSNKNDIDIKITDFGLAKAVHGNEDALKTFCGTPQYFAPEVLKRRNTISGRGRYGKQADMWSIGVILYVLLSGTPPFEAVADSVAYGKQIEFPDEFWFDVSADAKDLILKLLVKEPSKRYTIKDSCNHKWILTDDGDTHIHPLDDPQLVTLARKVLPIQVSKCTNYKPTSLVDNLSTKSTKCEKYLHQNSTYQRTNTNPVSPDNGDDIQQTDEQENVKPNNLASPCLNNQIKSENDGCVRQRIPFTRVSDTRVLHPISINNRCSIDPQKSTEDQTKAVVSSYSGGTFPQMKPLILKSSAGPSKQGYETIAQANSKTEPSDDEIISQFSDQTESISSFTSEPPNINNVNDSFTVATKLFQKISPLDIAANTGCRSKGKHSGATDHATESFDRKGPVKKPRKMKKIAIDVEVRSKLTKACDSGRFCRGKQMTLSGWVTK
jgi:serine/threonine protein kinase